MARPTALARASHFVGVFRWLFMPLGLFALVAVGVHAAADLVDDRLLFAVGWLDSVFDTVLAANDSTASWVDRIATRECTLIARSLALGWELGVDAFVALPALGYLEATKEEQRLTAFQSVTIGWRELFRRLNAKPTVMRVSRPVLTAIFALGGAYGVARLVESTLFVGLQGGVTGPDAAAVLARMLGVLALVVVLSSHGWRAVLRSLQRADRLCGEREKAGRSAVLLGVWGTALSLPLAVALVLEVRSLLSLVL